MSTDPLLFRIALSGDTMGTRYSALFFAPQAEGHAECAARLHDAVSDVDDVMSNWKPDSSISRLNRTKPGDWLELPESLLDVLETALAIERASKGAFDIGVADAVAHWGFGPDAGRRPAPEQGAQPRTCENLEIDVPPLNWTIRSWNFPTKIPGSGQGEFHEGIEVHGGADRLRSEAS